MLRRATFYLRQFVEGFSIFPSLNKIPLAMALWRAFILYRDIIEIVCFHIFYL